MTFLSEQQEKAIKENDFHHGITNKKDPIKPLKCDCEAWFDNEGIKKIVSDVIKATVKKTKRIAKQTEFDYDDFMFELNDLISQCSEGEK